MSGTDGRATVDPRDYQTFDRFDPSIDPPELPEEFDYEGVDATPLLQAVGTLVVAFNER